MEVFVSNFRGCSRITSPRCPFMERKLSSREVEEKIFQSCPVGKVAVNPVFDSSIEAASRISTSISFRLFVFLLRLKAHVLLRLFATVEGNLCRGNESRKMKRTGKEWNFKAVRKELIILKQ